MCKPDLCNGPTTRRVVVSGAGPAGILTVLHLLRRNSLQNEVKYSVTLVDGMEDFGCLTDEELKASHRSWMLALAGHGLTAIRTIPKLYEEYVRQVGVQLKSVSLHFGKKEIKNEAGAEGEQQESYIVDRNFVVAAMARYLNDHHEQDPNFTKLYHTKVQYVDGDNHRVLVRSKIPSEDGSVDVSEDYLKYDFLIGCDGVRSVVREAIIKRHRNFQFDIGDIFQEFKAVHVDRPKTVDYDSMHLLPAPFEHMQGIALPETGGKLNVTMGVPRHLFSKFPAELKSSDPKVVAAFVKENFTSWEFVDCDDFAEQWCNQKWNQTGCVHCNFYHSSPLKIIIMGDAAHATSPSIGMGMNTALSDAAALGKLLDEHKDNLEEILPAFSEARVKDGNSLTDMAMHLYCLDTSAQLIETVHMIIRGAMHKIMPKFLGILPHPQAMIGQTQYSLHDCYDVACKLGVIQKHRFINDSVQRDYFEEKVGMVTSPSSANTKSMISRIGVPLISAVVGAGTYYLAIKMKYIDC